MNVLMPPSFCFTGRLCTRQGDTVHGSLRGSPEVPSIVCRGVRGHGHLPPHLLHRSRTPDHGLPSTPCASQQDERHSGARTNRDPRYSVIGRHWRPREACKYNSTHCFSSRRRRDVGRMVHAAHVHQNVRHSRCEESGQHPWCSARRLAAGWWCGWSLSTFDVRATRDDSRRERI